TRLLGWLVTNHHPGRHRVGVVVGDVEALAINSRSRTGEPCIDDGIVAVASTGGDEELRRNRVGQVPVYRGGVGVCVVGEDGGGWNAIREREIPPLRVLEVEGARGPLQRASLLGRQQKFLRSRLVFGLEIGIENRCRSESK